MSLDIGMISSKELALLLGISDQTVRDLQKKQKITGENSGTRFTFNPYVCIPQYIQYVRELCTSDDAKERKTVAEADLVEAKAGIAKLEFGELKCEMHRSDDVRFFFADYCAHFRAELLSMPSRIPVLLNCPDKAEAAEKVSDEVAQMLERLKNYEYSRSKFRTAVRERRGWKEKKEDGEEDE